MNINEIIRKYDVKITYNKEDSDYIAKVINVDKISCVTGIGETREEALKELYIALEAVLESIIEKGWDIPNPKESSLTS
jgi:predicted RNase H-like HicB family nuclease